MGSTCMSIVVVLPSSWLHFAFSRSVNEQVAGTAVSGSRSNRISSLLL